MNGTNHGSRPVRQFTLQASILLGLAAVLTIGLFFLWWARHFVFLTLVGILLAIFLNALADALHRSTRLPYGWSVGVAVLAVLVVLGLIGWLIGARISDQIGELAQQLPASFQRIGTQLASTSFGKAVRQIAPQAGQSLLTTAVLSQATSIVGGLFEALADAVVVIFVGLYGAAQPGWYYRGFLHLVPPSKRARAEQVLGEIAYTLRWWLLGQLFSMSVIGVMVGLGLWLVGVPLPLALGFLAFLLEIVPYVGPFLSLIPALLLAAVQGPWPILWVLVVFTIVHIVEGYIVMPLVQLRTIRLPPAVNVLAVLFFGWLGGILGILVAAPMVITLILLVRMLYVEDMLGDWEAAPAGREGHADRPYEAPEGKP